ncbi:MAG: lipopolysaccharide kinase InaA family protein [Campylobacterota bacterium]|nr:lipopolysaccharide kinase InaA family protein [Campylobacterota bacterium]
MIKYTISKKFTNFKDFILNIKSNFNSNNKSIHKARNELKVINYNKLDTIVKSFKVPHLFNQIVYSFFRDSKAKKSYEYSLILKDFTPQPIGYIEFYSSFLLKESYFISERFDYDFTIREPLLDANFENKKNILEAFAKFTLELHNNNILHHDYSPGNILIKKENDDFIFKVVDINRMKFIPLDLDARLKNFAKLWMSDADMTIVASEYAKLIEEDIDKCIKLALKYSRNHKNKKNIKKRLKGEKVVD